MDGARIGEIGGQAICLAGRHRRAGNQQAEIDGDQTGEHCADDGMQQHDTAGRQPGGNRGADGNRHGKDRQIGGDDDLAAP